MTEFIGSRISLISKRDIRYVGTLHEISSENSTVALENVTSYGTEGRCPGEEVAPNLDNIYEYIVFRGSDVKDLRIEEGPKEGKKPEPPKMPDDPAILGSSRKPAVSTVPTGKQSATSSAQTQPLGEQNTSDSQGHPNQVPPSRQHPPPFQQPPYHYQFPPPNQRFGPGGPGGPPSGPGGFHPGPPGYGIPGLPYGAPPGWYPPQGFPHHMGPPNPFSSPPQAPGGLPGQQRQEAPNSGTTIANLATPTEESKPNEVRPVATVKLPSSASTPVPPQQTRRGPPPSSESKPDIMAALAPPAPSSGPSQIEKNASKNGRIVPAIPLSPASKKVASINGAAKTTTDVTEPKTASEASKSLEDANRDARAAVAAAMAKLPVSEKKQANNAGVIDSVTKAIGELKAGESSRGSRGARGGRAAGRGGRDHGRRIEVPKADFDFESANAKFNKHDLVKEAIATGSPIDTLSNVPNGDEIEDGLDNVRKGSEPGLSVPVGVSYNKSSSFFDDISSEIKDRAEIKETGQRVGGREYRNEERQKNLETFGQGSVDNNYRYGRGRGRGRAYGRGRGRGYDGRGGRSTARGRQISSAVEG